MAGMRALFVMAFYRLADYIKDELVSHALPSSLDDVIALATKLILASRLAGERDG